MRTTAQILASHRDRVRGRYFQVVGRQPHAPRVGHVPSDPQKALEMGIILGRKEGYAEGLVDGTQLGLDVGLEAVDEIMAQPVFLVSMPGGAYSLS